MKQSIVGFLLFKINVDLEQIPIMVYLNIIDAQQARDKLNSSRTDEEILYEVKYDIQKIGVVPG